MSRIAHNESDGLRSHKIPKDQSYSVWLEKYWSANNSKLILPLGSRKQFLIDKSAEKHQQETAKI